MQEFALIDQQAFEHALRQPLSLTQTREGGRYYPAFMDLVRLELATDYDRDTLSAQGLAIHTTLDPRLQQTAEAAAKATLATIERARGIPAGTLQVAIVQFAPAKPATSRLRWAGANPVGRDSTAP